MSILSRLTFRLSPIKAVALGLIALILCGVFLINGEHADARRRSRSQQQAGYQNYTFADFGFIIRTPESWTPEIPDSQYGADAVAVFTKAGNFSASDTPKMVLRRQYIEGISDDFANYQSKIILTYKGEHQGAQTHLDEADQRFLMVSNNQDSVSDPKQAEGDIQVVFVGTNDVVTLDFDLPVSTYNMAEKDAYDMADHITFKEGYGPSYGHTDYSNPNQPPDNDTGELMELIFDLISLLVQIGSFLVLLIVGYFVGKLEEGKHFKKIRYREQQTAHQPVITSKLKYALSPNDQEKIANCVLVCGSMVASEDYFKRILAALKCFFGGQIASYETLLDRARREAILRMKAQQPNADMYINVRTETSAIGQGRIKQNDVSSVEVLAYGTAIFFEQGRNPFQHRQVLVESNAESSLSISP